MQLHDTIVEVARGQVYPKMAQKTNCVDLPTHMAMVDVLEVLGDFDSVKIDYPPYPECITLGQCKDYCIMWPKTAIKLLVSPTSHISSPQTFDNDGCNGTGGDMGVDL